MESLRHFGSGLHSFYRAVIEWRSPATAPYLMLINTAFWATAFYCDATIQLRLLISLAAGVFGSDVLLTPSHERSIAMHIIMWPVQSLWRTLSVVGCFYSSHMLNQQELGPACWTAYSTVACLLINPVWTHYEANTKIANGARYCASLTASAAETAIVVPSKKLWSSIKYIVLLQFLPPLWRSICGLCGRVRDRIVAVFRSIGYSICAFGRSIAEFWRNWVVEPFKRRLFAVGRWLRYWLCAHWWPALKEWMRVKIGHPMKRLFNYICFGLVYLFCGHWVPPLARWIGARLSDFGSFLHRTIVVPTKNWICARFEELRVWLRAQLHRLAVAIRDSVLWPICVLVVEVGKQLFILLHNTLLKPVIDYFYQRYKIVETAALVYFLGPVCKTIVENIPEKSPFCEDSDVELEGMLPSDLSDGEIGDAGSERPDSVADLLPSPLDEEEHEFASGLAFPTIHASESSDEEFDLHHKNRTVHRRKREKKAGTSAASEGVQEGDVGSRRRARRPDREDDFELVQ